MKFIVNPFTGNFEAVANELWKCLKRTLATGEILSVDTLPLIGTHALTYVLAVHASNGSSVRREIEAVNDNGVIKYKVRRLGNTLDFEVKALVNGANIELQLTNLEAFSIDVEIARLRQ